MTPWHLRKAIHHLDQGEIIAYPTEGLYGLGCNPYDGQAVLQLLALKQRPLSRGLILIASHFDQLTPLLATLPKNQAARVQASWPGPNTWVWPCVPEVPHWLSGGRDTLAVRVTAHPIAAALCNAFGAPLVSTSANLSGHPPAHTALDVHRIFSEEIDYILHGDLSGTMQATGIRDARTGQVLRKG